MPSLTNRLKLALPNGNEYVNRAALNKIFEDIDRLVMLQGDFDTAKKEIDDILAKKVSKSGDTMTGSLKMTVPATGSVGYGFQDTTGAETSRLISVANGNVVWQDRTNLIDVLTYSPINKTFTMQAETNLLKKTGDTMSGDLALNRAGATTKKLTFQKDGVETFNFYNFSDTHVGLRDVKNNRNVWEYNTGTGSFDILAGVNSNLLKKTGDTMTGDLTMQANVKLQGDTERNLAFRTLSDNREFAKMYANPDKNRVGLYSTKNIKNVWEYDGSTDSFNVNTNTNLLKKTGDTMTGDLNFDVSAALKRISAYDGSTKVSSLAMTKTGLIFLEDGLRNNFNPWVYDSATQMFTVSANTNLLKKSGDVMTGQLKVNNQININTADETQGVILTSNSSRFAIAPSPKGVTDWTKEMSLNFSTGEVSVAALKVKGERALTISDAEEKIPSRSGKDENGIFATYEETQEDGKLWKRSVLSSPDADGNYLVRTVTYYKDGASYKTKIFDLKYDEDGDFVKAVPR